MAGKARPENLKRWKIRSSLKSSLETTSNKASGHFENMGTLTRTVVHSSEIKWAFEAQIRDEEHNDVVFIRERSIELKKQAHDFRLEDVAFKADFDSSIRAAAIIGTPKVLILQINGYKANEMGKGDQKMPKIPPQMLALALHTDVDERLVVLFARRSRESANVEFITFQHPLPPCTSERTGRLGEHLAVDPQSRFLAIAAQEGRFMLHKLKTASAIRKEMGTEENFDPISNSQLLKVEGFIFHMAFLHLPAVESSLVILVLILSVRGRLLLHVYEWDGAHELPRPGHKPRILPLSPELEKSLLLIPLTLLPGFALVCEKKIAVLSDVRVATSLSDEISLLDDERGHDHNAEEDPGNSRGISLHTAWARPHRHSALGAFDSRVQDVIYLCREDGLIRYVEFNLMNSRSLRCQRHTPLGHLRINANTAFTVIQNHESAADIILVGGHMSNGGIYAVNAHQDPRLCQIIPNWAPNIDFCSTRTEKDLHPTVFACAGRGRRHGAVVELQYGVQAQELLRSEVGEEWNQIWLLPDDNGILMHGILSSFTKSRLFSFAVQPQSSTSTSPSSPPWMSFMDQDRPTICASRTRDGLFIQVTDLAINAMLGPTNEDIRPSPMQQRVSPFVITGASIAGASSELAIIATSSSQYLLSYGKVNMFNGRIGLSNDIQRTLENEPTCVNIQPLEDATVVVVGTRAEEILVFGRVENQLNLIIRHSVDKDLMCESLLVVPHQTYTWEDCIIVAGLRSGSVLIMMLPSNNHGSYHLELMETVELGNTAVKVMPAFLSNLKDDELWPTGAAAICEDKTYQIEILRGSSASVNPIQRIWPIGPFGDGIAQVPIKSFAQLESWNQKILATSFSRLSYCILGSEFRLLVLKRERQRHLVPHRMPVGGVPTRVIALRQCAAFLVALTVNVVIDPSAQTGRVTDNARLTFSALKFLDPSEPELEQDQSSGDAFDVPPNLPPGRSSFSAIVGKSGEKILAMADWLVSSADKKWQLLLVGTQRFSATRARETGNIWMYSIISGRNSRLSLEWITNFDADEPVYSIAGYDDTSFVYCAGSRLYRQRLEISSSVRRTGVISADLRSNAGRNISVEKPYVYVSTLEHSMRVFEVKEDRLENVFNDSRARSSFSHVLSTTQPQFIFSSTLEGELTILQRPSQGTIRGDLKRIGHAKLPSTISSMREVSLAPPKLALCRSSVLASALDGSFYSISLVDPPMTRLLGFVQDFAQRDRRICPFGTADDALGHARMSLDTPRHIDADIIARVVEHFGEDLSGMFDLGGGDKTHVEQNLIQLMEDIGVEIATMPDGVFETIGYLLSLVLEHVA